MWLLETAAQKMGRKPPYTTPRQREIHALRYHDGTPDWIVAIVTGGARAGKSQLLADWGFSHHLTSGLGWVVGPDYIQARHEMRYIRDLLVAMGNFDETSSMPLAPGPWVIKSLTGCVIETKTSTDVEKIAGQPPDWIILVEAGQQPLEALLRSIERVMERDGQVLAGGTLENSQPWFAEYYEKFQRSNDERGVSINLPTHSNVHIFPKGENDPKFKKFVAALGGPESDWVQQRLYGIPKKPAGLVHPEFLQSVHANLKQWPISHSEVLNRIYSGQSFVQFWVDPGYAGAYAIIFATVIDGDVFLLHEEYHTGILQERILERVVTHPLFRYASHAVLDVAGRSHANAMESPKEVWPQKTGLPIHDQQVGIIDGIVRTASFLMDDVVLKRPKLFVHPSMEKTIWEYTQGYKRPVDSQGNVVGEKPIDRNNHAAKAIAYGLIDNFGLAGPRGVYGAGPRGRTASQRRHRRK